MVADHIPVLYIQYIIVYVAVCMRIIGKLD